MTNFTPDEWMCMCISRQVTDGEVLAQGINTPLVMAGFILAKLTHAPNVQFASAVAQGICQAWSPLSITYNEDFWLKESLMNVGFAVATADLLPTYAPKEFFRPAQIDSAGNFNNIAFGSDYSHPTLRLPGAGGIPDVTTYSDHVYLYVPRHSRVTFVKQVDYISGLGHSDKRQRGAGARYLVSDLGEFDWYEGQMRLIRHHPRVSIDRIVAKTGFPLQIAPDIHPIPAPSADEIGLLREVIDPLNIRKLETLGGAERKALLRHIIEQERRTFS
ncbi:MAG: CoA-transferase [Phototrophicales bacterium]|nr:CoA-transferase [Phototrophicales bacterium]